MFKVKDDEEIAVNFLVKDYAVFVQAHKEHMVYSSIASTEPDGRVWVIGDAWGKHLDKFQNDDNIIQKDRSRSIGTASNPYTLIQQVTWGEVNTEVKPEKVSTVTWADLNKQLGPVHWPLDKDEEAYMKEWEDIMEKEKEHIDPEMHGHEDDEFVRKNSTNGSSFIDLPNRPQNYFRSLPSYGKK